LKQGNAHIFSFINLLGFIIRGWNTDSARVPCIRCILFTLRPGFLLINYVPYVMYGYLGIPSPYRQLTYGARMRGCSLFNGAVSCW